MGSDVWRRKNLRLAVQPTKLGRDSEFASLFKRLQVDVAEPNVVSVILETDVAASRKILQCGLELIFGAIGILLGRCPFVQIRVYNSRPI